MPTAFNAPSRERPATRLFSYQYGAIYQPGSSWCSAPSSSVDGSINFTLSNTSNFTWPANGPVRLAYHVYEQNPSTLQYSLVNWDGTRTLLPYDLPPNFTQQFCVNVSHMTPGTYLLAWDMVWEGNTWWSAQGVPTVTSGPITYYNQPPALVVVGPSDGATESTNSPVLSAYASDPDSWPGPLQYEFRLCDIDSLHPCIDSGWQPNSTWSPTSPALYWDTTYFWTVSANDGQLTTGPSLPSSVIIVVPRNHSTSYYGTDPTGVDQFGINLWSLNYVSPTTDLTVTSPEPWLSVTRTYNSLDTTTHAFGTGWSSLLDMRISGASTGPSISFADGRAGQFEENPDGSYSGRFGDPTTRLTQGPSGIGYVLTMRDGTSYSFDGSGNLVEITSPKDDVKVGRDGSNRISSLTSTVSNRGVAFTYNGTLVSTATNFVVNTTSVGPTLTWTYGYQSLTSPTWGDTMEYLTTACDARPRNPCTTYHYTTTASMVQGTGLFQVTAAILPSGKTPVSMQYDAYDGLVTGHQDAYGAAWTYSQVGVSAPLSVETTVTYPPWATGGQPSNYHARYDFDTLGRLVDRDTFSNNMLVGWRAWDYDYRGQFAGSEDENGHLTEVFYSVTGDLTDHNSYRDANTVENTHYDYWLGPPSDPRAHKVVSVTPPNFEQGPAFGPTTYSYDTAGHMVSETKPAVTGYPHGTQTSWTYTGYQLDTATDTDNNTSQYYYNAHGDVNKIVDPTGLITKMTYDDLGELLTRKQISDTFPNGVTTKYTYDALGRVRTEVDPQVTDAVTGVSHQLVVTYTYDVDENLSTTAKSDVLANDASRSWQYFYDQNNRQNKAIDPTNSTTSRVFDAMGNLASSTDALGGVHTYLYNNIDLLSEVDLAGFADDPVNNPTTTRTVTLARYSYDPGGRMIGSIDARGEVRTYTYYDDDLPKTATLVGFHNPEGTSRNVVLEARSYDLNGNATSTTTGNGLQTIAETYDAQDRLSTSTMDPNGLKRTTTYSYDGEGHVGSMTLSDGTRTEHTAYAEDVMGRPLTRIVDAGGGTLLTTTYQRDQRGFPVGVTDPRGAGSPPNPAYTTNTVYDELGRVTATLGPPVTVMDGGTQSVQRPTVKTGYDTFGEIVELQDARGFASTRTYDKDGRVLSRTLPPYTTPAGVAITSSESVTYDSAGNLRTQKDGVGNTTTNTWDLRNRLVQVVGPALMSGVQPVATYKYDDDGNQLQSTDPTGAVTLSTYDDLGRRATKTQEVRSSSPTAMDTTTWGYDDLGDRTSITDPMGVASTATYDASGAPTSVSLCPCGTSATPTSKAAYDVAGRMTRATDPSGRSTLETYDLAGRPSGLQHFDSSGNQVDGATATPDGAGNVVAWTSADSITSTAVYDAMNRMTSQTDPVTSGTVTTNFGYDAAGNLSMLTDANTNVTTATYTSWELQGNVVEPATVAYPAGADRTLTTTYDADQRPVEEDQPGGVVLKRTYDALGRLTNGSASGGAMSAASRSLGYDLDGRLTSVDVGSQTQKYTYDDRGVVLDTSGPEGSATMSYNASGQLSSRVDAAGTSTFGYDTSGRLGSATDGLTGVTLTLKYDIGNQLGSVTRSGSGVISLFGYDQRGRLASDVTSSAGGATLTSRTYGYDPDSNLKTETLTDATGAPAVGQGKQTFTYDPSDRLISTTAGGLQTDYGLDGVGNRVGMTVTNASTHAVNSTDTSNFDARNRLLSTTHEAGSTTTTTTYGYDALGDRTTTAVGSVTTISAFDAFGRMTSQGSSSFTYDGLDRVATVRGSAVRYDDVSNDAVKAEGTLVARAPDGTVLATQNGGVAGLADLNQHGDVTAVRDPATNNALESSDFDPYGAPRSTHGSTPAVGFQSALTDTKGGSVAMGARWFSPSSGTFASRDSAPMSWWNATSPNRYDYAGANPLTRVDPTGHDWCLFFCGALQDVGQVASSGAGDVVGFVSTAGLSALDALTTAAGPAVEGAAAVSCFADPVCWVVGGLVAVGTGLATYIVTSPGELAPIDSAGSTSDPALPQTPTDTSATPAPVTVTGTATQSVVTANTELQSWFADGVRYSRTDNFVYTTVYSYTYFSDGSSQWTSTSGWTDNWVLTSRPIIDLSDRIPTPPLPVPLVPVLDLANGTAPSDGACGLGGAVSACLAGIAGGSIPPTCTRTSCLLDVARPEPPLRDPSALEREAGNIAATPEETPQPAADGAGAREGAPPGCQGPNCWSQTAPPAPLDPEEADAGGMGSTDAAKNLTTVTREGLTQVETHLAQFGADPPNEAMIARLQGALDNGGGVTGADANFYNHEVTESELMAKGVAYGEAHDAALEAHGASPFSLYHPDVMQHFPEYFNDAYRAFWGL